MEKFINQLKDYKEAPSDQVWDRLEDRLDLQSVKQSRKKYRLLAYGSVLALGLVLLFMILPSKPSNPDLFVSISNDKSQIVGELSLEETPADMFTKRNRDLVDLAYAKLAAKNSY